MKFVHHLEIKIILGFSPLTTTIDMSRLIVPKMCIDNKWKVLNVNGANAPASNKYLNRVLSIFF